jgi:hypothetical protein
MFVSVDIVLYLYVGMFRKNGTESALKKRFFFVLIRKINQNKRKKGLKVIDKRFHENNNLKIIRLLNRRHKL